MINKSDIVERTNGSYANVKKGKKYIVQEVSVDGNDIRLKELDDLWYNIEKFKKINKFSKNEQVMHLDTYDSKVVHVFDNRDVYGIRYAITYVKEDGKIFHRLVDEEELSKKVDKRNLKQADIFISNENTKVKIISRTYDENYDKVVYFGKIIGNSNSIGLASVWKYDEIKKVVECK